MIFPKSIKWQLILSTTSLIIIFGISSFISFNILEQMGIANRNLVFKSLPAVQTSSQLAHLAHEMVILGYEFETIDNLVVLKHRYVEYNQLQDSMSEHISAMSSDESGVDILSLHSNNQKIRNLTSIIYQLKTKRLSQNNTSSNELAKDSLRELHDLTNTLASITTDYAEQIKSATSKNALVVDSIYKQGRNTIISMLLIIVIPILCIFWFYVVRRISNRLTLLSGAITQLETVLPNTKISINGQDEIAKMARSTESLLKNRFELLRERNILEERVLERTKKLEDEINERKQTEKKFRDLVEGSLQGIVVHDDFKPLFINKHCADIFGYADPEEILILNSILDIFWEPKERKRLSNYNQSLLDEEEVPDYFEVQGLRDDDNIIWLGCHISTIDWLGKTAVMMAFIDITKRMQAEQAMRRSHKMEAVGQLTGGIAHDFNNILGIITGNLSLLKKQSQDREKFLYRLGNIDTATHRATELVKNLLGFSRLQATDIEFCNLNKIIRGMDNLIKRSVTPEIEVDLQLSESLWSTQINQGDFQDVLLNLVLNARDAMSEGGQLTIKTSNCILDNVYCDRILNLTPGEYVKLDINDTGIGIHPEQLDKVYEPFFTTKEVGRGTGLGLSMVFGFISRSDGHINVESKLDIGTIFHLYLPRSEGQNQSENIKDVKLSLFPKGSETVLVVDDEEEMIEIAKELLISLGYQVFTANNGNEALAQLATHSSISLLFSDVVMPGGINGFELAEQAMKNHPNIKVLLTSGHTEKAKIIADSKINLLTKPYRLDELANRIRFLLDNL